MPSYLMKSKLPTYYKLGKENNTTVVGSFGTILNGVASGFTAGNYLKLPKDFDVVDGSSWEMVWRIKTPSAISSAIAILGRDVSSGFASRLLLGSDRSLGLYLANGTSAWTVSIATAANVIEFDVEYDIKASYENGIYSLFYKFSKDEEWILVGTQNAEICTQTNFIRIGHTHDSGSGKHFTFTGSIDLSQSYISINGERWWSGDDYVAVGSWIDEGVASGFSSANYLTLPKTIKPLSNPWELVVKFKTGTLSGDQAILGSTASSGRSSGMLVYTSGSTLLSCVSSNGSSDDIAVNVGSASLVADTDYWYKAEFTGNAYNFYYSIDGVVWNDAGSVESSKTIYQISSEMMFGVGHLGGSKFYTGATTFYLDESYLKVNGECWWTGTKGIESTKDAHDYYTTETKNYVMKSKFPTYYKHGKEANVNKTGSWGTILNGVASGFQGTTNLVTVDSFAPVAGDTWEMMFKLRTGSDITTSQQFLGGVSSNDSGIEIAVASSKWKWWVGTGSSYNLANGISGTYTVLTNTDYWVKVIYNGTNITLYYSLDGDEFIQDLQVATTSPIYANRKAFGCDAYSDGSKWLGSIDFNETYINLNGERWWDITKPYVRDGSWIDEGVASGFSTSQYLSIPRSFNQNVQGSKWEIVGKFKLDTLGVRSPVFGGASGTYLLDINISVDNKFLLALSTNGSSYNIIDGVFGTYVFEAGVDYWAKLTFDGSKYVLSYSLDGINYIEDVVVESTLQIENTADLLCIGFRAGCYLRGSIDLKECYVKINGQMWWTGTKGIESTKDDYDYYTTETKTYTTKVIKYKDVPNATVVGSPTIVDGVVSGFSTSNSLSLPDKVPANTDFEMLFKVLPNALHTETYNIFAGASGYCSLCFTVNGKLGVYKITTWDSGTSVYNLNEYIWVKVTGDGTSYNFYCLQDDNYTINTLPNISNWVLENTWNTTTNVWGGDTLYIGNVANNNSQYFGGSIDLSQSYININGERWWTGIKAEKY